MIPKKGTSIGMVFVFIVAALTFALIMIFGYKAIAEFVSKGEMVEFYQFKSDLETSIRRIYTEYGSVRVEEFHPPLKYEKICFIDLDTRYPGDDACDFDAYACDVWKTAWEQGGGWAKADENVFLKPPAPIQLKVYKIEVEGGEVEGALCLDIAKGKFKVKLEGRGDKTLISPSPSIAVS